MSLLSSDYRTELNALLSRSSTVPVQLSKSFSSTIQPRLVYQSRARYQLGGQAVVNEDRSGASYTPMRIKGGKTLLAFDEALVADLFGETPMRFADISIGPHPDFASLPHNCTAEHFCVSMFVDIVGSTRLITNGYSLLEIRRIKDTVLSLFIQVANFFGGHVHRLQGDAAFLQFVRVEEEPSDCIINALNAATLISFFVTHYLADDFKNNGVDPLSIRVGIDYGAQEDVLWSHYGLPGCSELTTTSLYTDLAAKLQAKAAPNEVRIGANIRKLLDLPDEFCSVPVLNGTYDHFIFPEQSYRQYIFDWRKFLCSYDFATFNDRTKRIDINSNPNRAKLICELYSEHDDYAELEGIYNQNSCAIPKGKGVKFRIVENQAPYQRKLHHVVTWQIENRGAEAMADFDKSWQKPQVDTELKPVLETGTTFTGHHYMRCRVQRPAQPDLNLRLPVFVRDIPRQILLD